VAIAWRRLDSPGHDAAILRAADEGWLLEGVAAFLEEGSPSHLRYLVRLDSRWHTRSAKVEGWWGTAPVKLAISVGPTGDWLLNGEPAPAVSGASDIDLAFTPATNLLPIRRLQLAVGQSTPVVAAWLPFPELTLRLLDQVYRRASANTYDYSSSGGSFQAALSVSPEGFVTDYPGLWVQERG
jgi:uncharacterized protein